MSRLIQKGEWVGMSYVTVFVLTWLLPVFYLDYYYGDVVTEFFDLDFTGFSIGIFGIGMFLVARVIAGQYKKWINTKVRDEDKL